MKVEHRDVTTVYQYFDDRGRLLYVGVTARNVRRAQEHAETKAWWPSAVGCTLEHFDTREAALKREREIIQGYLPPYNTVHNAFKAEAQHLHEVSTRTAPASPAPERVAHQMPPPPSRPKRRARWERTLMAAERRAAEEGYVPKF